MSDARRPPSTDPAELDLPAPGEPWSAAVGWRGRTAARRRRSGGVVAGCSAGGAEFVGQWLVPGLLALPLGGRVGGGVRSLGLLGLGEQ